MSCTTSPADRSKPILPDLDIIATHTGMVVRKSPKFNPTALLLTLMSSVVTGKGSLSYERLYHVLTSYLIGVVDLAGLEKFDQDLDPRHVTCDKRGRQSPDRIRDSSLNLTRMGYSVYALPGELERSARDHQPAGFAQQGSTRSGELGGCAARGEGQVRRCPENQVLLQPARRRPGQPECGAPAEMEEGGSEIAPLGRGFRVPLQSDQAGDSWEALLEF